MMKSISLEKIYNKYGSELTYGKIHKTVDNESEYYDLYYNNRLVCMDGEECLIKYVSEKVVNLVNKNGEKFMEFKLSYDEFVAGRL